MVLRVVCFVLLFSRIVFANEAQFRGDGFMNKLSSGMKFAQNLLATKKGTIQVVSNTGFKGFLEEVLYCPDVPYNLLSVSKMQRAGMTVTFDQEGTIISKDGKVLMRGQESVALKVAEFVVKAFQTANRPVNRKHPSQVSSNPYGDEDRQSAVDEVPNPMAPLKHLVQLFGLQPNQISAVAVNALIFVAQMISTFLAGPRRPERAYTSEDPKSWILNKNSRQLQDLITAAKNETLPDSIEELIKQNGSEEETSCIRLLVCKITPFVNRMQKAVFGQDDVSDEKVKGAAIMYRHLPSADEINDRSDLCEKRHRACNLNE